MSGNLHRQSECRFCNSVIEWEAIEIQGRVWELAPSVCDDCEGMRANGSEATLNAKADRIAEFKTTIPRIFRDTDKARLPSSLTIAADAWAYGPQGLAFAGPSGKGKTRAMFILLQRMAGEGRSVGFITSTDFDHISRDQFSDDAMERNQAKEKLRSIRSVRVLLLDDLGKGKMTERSETELFALFDSRTSAGLPTLWTSNLSSRELLSMVAMHNRDAFERRIGKEFTTIITP
ncbi:MAG: ATP-binding protein [Verrucomicrobia bacterium]|nr:ATP-binding protein [Verrucomicrobiota bacterium]